MAKQEEISLLLRLKDSVTKGIKKIGVSFKNNMDAMKQSAVIFAGVFAGMIAGVWKSVDAFKEQERVEAELETRLKSTGHAAGLTADEIKNMARELQKTTGVSDEVTLSAQNMLLTFTNIGKESFPGATQAVLDMTAAMNKGKITQEGLKASAIMLGKGLNDPIGQLGALSRVGIAFTDQQKGMIKEMAKSGDMAGAQAIILAELKKEFGGTSENLNTLEGAQRASSAAFGDMLEIIGQAFLPIMTSISQLIKDVSLKMQAWLPKVKDLIVPITVLIGVLTGLMAVGGAIVVLGPTIGAAFTAMLGPIGLAVLAVAGITSAVLYFKNSSSVLAVTVRSAWNTMGTIIKEYSAAIWDEIKNLGKIFVSFGEAVAAATTGRLGKAKEAFSKMQSGLKNTGKAFSDASDTIKQAYADNVQAEKDALKESQEVQKEDAEIKREIKREDGEIKAEMDQEFIDNKAEMDAIAEDARKEFEAQKLQFDAMTAQQRYALLVDTLGKESILKETDRINDLIAKGKYEDAKKKQDEMYAKAFVKINKETIDELDKGWKKHWTYLLLGQKMNVEDRRKLDDVAAQSFSDLMTLFGEESIAAFRLMQAASISQTIIKTYEAAQNAFTALSVIPVVGPVLGGIAAGAAIAAGIARVNAIRMQEPPKAETGAYVKSGGYAELHDQEMVLNKEQTAALASGGGKQNIYLQMNGETIQKWIVATDEESRKMERVGIR